MAEKTLDVRDGVIGSGDAVKSAGKKLEEIIAENIKRLIKQGLEEGEENGHNNVGE